MIVVIILFSAFLGRMECYGQNSAQGSGYVDLGLPSGTSWKESNEGTDYYSYTEALSKFGNNLPTHQQLEELRESCQWVFADGGYQVTGPNGNVIFLPTAGIRFCNGTIYGIGLYGYFWSRTTDKSENAWYIGYNAKRIDISKQAYCIGLPIRLVR